jgi:hypothetical protein
MLKGARVPADLLHTALAFSERLGKIHDLAELVLRLSGRS